MLRTNDAFSCKKMISCFALMMHFPAKKMISCFVLMMYLFLSHFIFCFRRNSFHHSPNSEFRIPNFLLPNSEFRIFFFSEFTASYSAKALLLSFPYSQYREAPGRLRTAPPFRDRKSPYYRNSQHPYSVRFL